MLASVDEQRHQLAVETLEDLEWCLEQLETTQTDRSVSDLATNKVREMPLCYVFGLWQVLLLLLMHLHATLIATTACS